LSGVLGGAACPADTASDTEQPRAAGGEQVGNAEQHLAAAAIAGQAEPGLRHRSTGPGNLHVMAAISIAD